MLSQELPAWDAFDRHVLRFSGYFKEGVVEEHFRTLPINHGDVDVKSSPNT